MGEKNIDFGDSLWNIKLQTVGMMFHIFNKDDVNPHSHPMNKMCSCLCGSLFNCVKCNCCYPSAVQQSDRDKYIIYRAEPKGFDEIIISSRMALDHVPHIYNRVINCLDLEKLRHLTFDTD